MKQAITYQTTQCSIREDSHLHTLSLLYFLKYLRRSLSGSVLDQQLTHTLPLSPVRITPIYSSNFSFKGHNWVCSCRRAVVRFINLDARRYGRLMFVELACLVRAITYCCNARYNIHLDCNKINFYSLSVYNTVFIVRHIGLYVT
jgi:hypothetical protein